MCPFWNTCAAGIVRNYIKKHKSFEEKINWVDNYCLSDSNFNECIHFQIKGGVKNARTNPRG